MSATSSIAEAFESAKKDFLQKLTNPQDYDFSKFNSIDEVYDATDEIQEEQARSGTLRNLRKIQPYLDCLNQYAGVLDTFIQVKPEILTLIWVGWAVCPNIIDQTADVTFCYRALSNSYSRSALSENSQYDRTVDVTA